MSFYTVSKGITRFEPETGARFGFMVRICRNGQRINEFFSDKAYKGKRNAKIAAQARYAELIEEYGPSNQHSTRDVLTDRNTTGYVGVHLAKSIDKIWTNHEYFAYCASWVEEGGQRRKIAFSISKHGKKGALELAVLARKSRLTDREKLLEMYEKQKTALKSSTSKGASQTKPSKTKPSKKKPSKTKPSKKKPSK